MVTSALCSGFNGTACDATTTRALHLSHDERCRRAVPGGANGDEPSQDTTRVWHPKLHAGQGHAQLMRRSDEVLADDRCMECLALPARRHTVSAHDVQRVGVSDSNLVILQPSREL